MKKKALLSFTLSICLHFAVAQELWLQPNKFNYKKGDKLEVNVNAGKLFIGEPLTVKRDQLDALVLHQNTKAVDLLDSVKEGTKNHLSYLLSEEGTQLLVMRRKIEVRHIGAEEFNDYLKENGLDEILDSRKNNNRLSAGAKENYFQDTKLLFQVAAKKDDTFKKIIGLPAEIVPEKNPYSLKVGDPIRFKILFDGKPVFGVRVKVWNRFENRTTIQNIYTEKDGTFESRISNPGPWMISVVKMTPAKEAGVDWQSYSSSLLFGIEK